MKTERCVLDIKSYEDQEDRYKVKYGAGGNRGIMKDHLVLGAQTIHCVYLRIILIRTKSQKFSHLDRRLQACIPIVWYIDHKNDVYHELCPGIQDISPRIPWNTQTNLWFSRFKRRMISNFGWLYAKKIQKWYQPLLALHSTSSLKMSILLVSMETTLIIYSELEPKNGKKSNATLKRFGSTRSEQTPFTFAGMHIIIVHDMLHSDQDFYMTMIRQTSTGAGLSNFTSKRMELAR